MWSSLRRTTLRRTCTRSFRVPMISNSQFPRTLSITCRGKAIGHEELYQYSNGRFMVDEEAQYKRRRVTFDVAKLCDIVATAGQSKSPVVAIEKLEGGFNKALLMSKDDGTQLIAKIPCNDAGLSHYSTASEVAVLRYIKSFTTIPVPEVFAWSSDVSNSVGCEYIIMEKASGTQLFKVWDNIEDEGRLNLIRQLTELESQLANLVFPATGNLYLQRSEVNEKRRTRLGLPLDPSDDFCIGPSCDRAWLNGTSAVKTESVSDQGPWPSVYAYGIALAEREATCIQQSPKTVTASGYCDRSVEQVSLLKMAINLLQSLRGSDALEKLDTPTLWHTDLHMGNIYVSEKDTNHILSIIDWQSIAVQPLFLQADWPIFLKPKEGYEKGSEKKPTLPENFDELSPEDKDVATYQWRQETCTKAYEVSTFLNNEKAYYASNAPRVLKELFLRCGSTWEEGVIPLRACLIEIFQSWESLAFPGKCPYSFEEDEIEAHAVEFAKYEDWHKVQEIAREYLNTDADGWIPPEQNFEEKVEQNRALFEMLVSEMAGEKSRDELLRMWPFSDHL